MTGTMREEFESWATTFFYGVTPEMLKSARCPEGTEAYGFEDNDKASIYLTAAYLGWKAAWEARQPSPDVTQLVEALERVREQVDGNIRETVRDCVNGRPDVQDIYEYCDSIDAIIDAARAQNGESLARRFHEIYERLAPTFGYQTRDDTKQFDPKSANGRLMVAVCKEILAHPLGQLPAPDVSGLVEALEACDTALFCDLKTDEEKSTFFLSGRGYETGVIAQAIQNDVAMAYHRCSEYREEMEALQAENALLRAAIRHLCNIYVVDDYYEGQLREESLEVAVNQAIEQVQEGKSKS